MTDNNINNSIADVCINDESIERVQSIKYLGIQIDDELKFSNKCPP